MKRIIILSLMTLMMAIVPQWIQARNYALCVGLDAYPAKVGRYRVKPLRVSGNDARVMKKMFAANGFSTSLLTDSAATCEAVLRAMKYRFCTAREDDVVIFYFSGHGTEEGLLCYDNVLSTASIVEEFKRCKARTKMLIADACYSGRMRNDTVWQNTFPKNEDVILFLSSRTSEVSLETMYSNSLFTMYLERGLRGGADVNKDKKITARELYDFVHESVTDDHFVNGSQHPVMWGGFDGNSTIVNWERKAKKNKNKDKKQNIIDDDTSND